jgi:hypothetical protein
MAKLPASALIFMVKRHTLHRDCGARVGFAVMRQLWRMLTALMFASIVAQGGGQQLPPTGLPVSSSPGQLFDSAERSRVLQTLLNRPEVTTAIEGHRFRVLRLLREFDKTRPARQLGSALLFDHTTGKAWRFFFDLDSEKVVRREVLSQPQPSKEELEEAATLIKSNPVFSRLVRSGNSIEGGFTIQGPPSAPLHHRLIRMWVLSADRKTQGAVIVDLTLQSIARYELK